jgi:hypothetical protein
MPNEDVIFDGNPLTDEGVAGDFAAAADLGVFLDFDERADFGLASDLAPVEIDELREPDILAQFYVI